MYRTIVPLIAGLLFTLPVMGQKLESCKFEKDEFTGKTSVQCPHTQVAVEEQPIEKVYAAYASVAMNEGQYALIVTMRAESWNLLSEDTAYAIIDGKRHEFGAAPNRNGNEILLGGKVAEQLLVVIPNTAVEKLASAEEFRVKIGTGVYDFSPVTEDFATIINQNY